jgi:hypothetical protein
MCGNRKQFVVVAIECHVLQQKTKKQVVATNSLLRPKKPWVAAESSHVWQ